MKLLIILLTFLVGCETHTWISITTDCFASRQEAYEQADQKSANLCLHSTDPFHRFVFSLHYVSNCAYVDDSNNAAVGWLVHGGVKCQN